MTSESCCVCFVLMHILKKHCNIDKTKYVWNQPKQHSITHPYLRSCPLSLKRKEGCL